MKHLEKIKFIIGFILISFSIVIGLCFFIEAFGIAGKILNNDVSMIFKDVSLYEHVRGSVGGRVSAGGSANTVIFFGLCGLAGAYLLASVKK